MALSKISELGSGVCVDSGAELTITALADGTAKAGWYVGLTAAGVVAGADSDSPDAGFGLLLKRYDTDLDTSPTATRQVRVVIPRAGRRYRVFCADMNASLVGLPMNVAADAGKFAVVATVESYHLCRCSRYTDGDTVAEVIWGV